MHYKHIMLEVYCDKDKGECDLFPGGVNFRCLDLKCEKLSFAPCPDEFAYTDENGIASAWIGFGGDMDNSRNDEQRSKLTDKWAGICKDHIETAYKKYMTEKEQYL